MHWSIEVARSGTENALLIKRLERARGRLGEVPRRLGDQEDDGRGEGGG